MPTYDELKDQQRRQWSDNAAGWDSQHDRLAREAGDVSRWICRQAGLRPGMRVLDIACGAGHPSIDAAALVAPGGSVVATDLVPEMVEFTMRRVRDLGIDNVEGMIMDAEAIDFPDESFDAVTCRFGIMFCPRPEVAATEIRRVLRPGGSFAACVWSEPHHNSFQTVVGEAFVLFGRPQRPVDFDLPGIYQLAPEGKLEDVLRRAGFSEVRIELQPRTWEYANLDDLWQRQMIRAGPVRNAVETFTPEDLARLRECLVTVLKPYTDEAGVIRLVAAPLCAVALK